MIPKMVCVSTYQDPANIVGMADFHFKILGFRNVCWISRFTDIQIPEFPDFASDFTSRLPFDWTGERAGGRTEGRQKGGRTEGQM